MENLTHSQHPNMLSKKPFTNPSKTVYDDVFSAPPRFGAAPTLSPRVEDYGEIFGAFHAPRGASSSIPVLDLPLVDNEAAEDVFFDVRSCSGFDYNEVFGGFNASDFDVSFEELMMEHSNGRDFSSDEAWTPEDPEYLSEESDNSAKNQCLSNGDSHESIDGSMEFNISYHKASQSSNKDMTNGITHVTKLFDVPGYAFMVDKSMSLPKTDNEYPPLHVSDDGHLNIDFMGEMMGEKKLRKTMSHPANGSADGLVFGNEVRPHKEYVRNVSLPNETFVTISDVNLKTYPSQLPPPSRPPPAFDFKKRDFSKSTPNCQGVASSGSAGDSSPPYFDVEVDASSSAAASAAAIKEAMEKAQAKLKSAKELMERKRDGFQSRTKSGSKNDRKDREGRVSKNDDVSSSKKYEEGTCERENKIEFSVMEERKKIRIPDSVEGKRHRNAAEKSSDEKHGRESLSSQGSDRIDEAGEWKEATQFFELVRTNVPRKVTESEKNDNILLQNINIHEQGQKVKKAATEAMQQQQENGKEVQTFTADHELEEYAKNPKVSKPAHDHGGSNGRSEAAKVSHGEKGLAMKVQVAQEVFRVEDEERFRMNLQSIGTEKRQTRANGSQKHENVVEVPREQSKIEVRQTAGDKEKGPWPKEAIRSVENEKQLIRKKDGGERRGRSTFEQEENEKMLKAPLEQMGNERRLKEALKQGEKERRINEACVREETEKKQREAYEKEEKEKRLRAALEWEENERKLKEAFVKEENARYERRLGEATDREENERRQREVREREENEKRLKEALEKEQNEGRLIEFCQSEENEKRPKEALEHENKKKQKEANEREGSEKQSKEVFENEGIEETLEQEANEKRLEETNELVESGKLREALEGEASELGTCEPEEIGDASQEICNLGNIEVTLKDVSENDELGVLHEMGGNCRVAKQACETDENRNLGSTRLVGKHEGKNRKQEVTGENAHEEISKVPPGLKIGNKEATVETVNVQVDRQTKVSGVDQGNLEHEKNQSIVEDDAAASVYGDERMRKAGEAGNGTGQMSIEKTKKAFQIESDTANQGKEFAQDRGERRKNMPQAVVMNQEDRKDNFMSTGAEKKSIVTGRKIEAAQPADLEAKGSTLGSTQQFNVSERKMKNLNKTLSPEEKEAERLRREKELEMECLRKMEEEREREREREKDRMAVDRAVLEARERVHTEACDRAERAAVERAITEARERLEKACVEAREKSLADNKTYLEARLRERAAVERATAEVRERAFGKVMSERTAFETRERVERSVSDKFSASSRNGGMGPSSSSSVYNGSYYMERSEGVEGESPQRCKARLERHRRTAERAAKALAEKNTRDLLAQREQAERNRLAETLDADVKRWSSGKEGNLRALLSTLQYILGPDSGWQPIPLTEVITSAAVKKVYRKATLCVHPDKLQQRGASLQQKYICEKVFDLLKEAWNKFNSEER
ncbi:auxilin-like protein 1 [Populus alba x Populus x berolinensis]|uniref:Auxilin-like protein 1 n=1 Tax=Populus alba x Populus x berolinensis TaxID=444605 RepID=A0AAD6QVU9_9ROSI|nr:auxilin-like protein 1 [Populus alba x Populus x berolinensis]